MTDEWQNDPFYQVNTYLEWVKTEGVPIVEAYAVDCLTQPLEPSPRLGGLGAYIHLVGRGDAATCYLAEIPARASLNPERHLHDKLIHVLAGRGATTVEAPRRTDLPPALQQRGGAQPLSGAHLRRRPLLHFERR